MPGPVRPLRLPALCLVTDRSLCRDAPLEEKVAKAVAGGVTMVQLREKDLPGKELLAMAERVRALLAGTSPPAERILFVVNDRLDVAMAVGADGAHLPESGMPVEVARRLLGPHALIGRSVHSVAAAKDAERHGADYLIVGAMFATRSHPGKEPEGLPLLRAVRQAVGLPLLAIGGITASNVRQVMEAGADGIAVTSAILAAPDSAQAARDLRDAMALVRGTAQIAIRGRR